MQYSSEIGSRGQKPKSTPISLFLFHLYHSKKILTEQEEVNYEAIRELISYKITPEFEPWLNLVSKREDQETKLNLGPPTMSLEN